MWRKCASVTYTNTGSDNSLLPVLRQVIFWTNADLLTIEPSRINLNGILIKIPKFSFTKLYLKCRSSVKRRPFCLSLNVLISHSAKIDKVIVHLSPKLTLYLFYQVQNIAMYILAASSSCISAFVSQSLCPSVRLCPPVSYRLCPRHAYLADSLQIWQK